MLTVLIALASAQPAVEPAQRPHVDTHCYRPLAAGEASDSAGEAVRMEEVSNPDGTRTLRHTLVVPAPPAEVYAAFSTPEGWRAWAVPNAWTVPGDADLLETSYTLGAAPGDPRHIRQRFLLRVPNRLVEWRTVQTPPGFPHAAEFQRVTTRVELEPAGSGTRVRLSGIGYPAGAAGDTLLAFFREGNRTTLEQLRARFVTGPIDWAARDRAAAK
jgi:uncharacterized protein YndB with AHSA1/START domain